jgi:hypothetical protein
LNLDNRASLVPLGRVRFYRIFIVLFSGGRVSVGRYADRMSGGGNPRGVPAKDPGPLEAFKKEIDMRKRSRWRT